MTSKMPPVPPENRSKAGPGSNPNISKDDVKAHESDRNVEQQGRQGNIHQNTHHQGYQQDR